MWNVEQYLKRLWCGIVGHRTKVDKDLKVEFQEFPGEMVNAHFCGRCGVHVIHMPMRMLVTLTVRRNIEKARDNVMKANPLYEALKKRGAVESFVTVGKTVTEPLNYKNDEENYE